MKVEICEIEVENAKKGILAGEPPSKNGTFEAIGRLGAFGGGFAETHQNGHFEQIIGGLRRFRAFFLLTVALELSYL